MRVAALYDIHGNLRALDAVLASIGVVDHVLIGGDVVWGPWPQETMDVLRSLPSVEFIMGNADRDVFMRKGGDWKHVNDWCADRLTDAHLEFLRTRPATLAIDGVLYCHGSPQSDTDTITLRTPPQRILGWCDGFHEPTIVCGHTHGQFERVVDGRRVVNAGSVGEPFGDRGAYFAVLDDGDVELRFVPYDVDRVADEIVATGYPYGPIMAANLRSVNTADDAARWFERS
jgi:diadenosine tetraphosphatase ApaH/serine/threonine PP2A family protein phosphatase